MRREASHPWAAGPVAAARGTGPPGSSPSPLLSSILQELFDDYVSGRPFPAEEKNAIRALCDSFLAHNCTFPLTPFTQHCYTNRLDKAFYQIIQGDRIWCLRSKMLQSLRGL